MSTSTVTYGRGQGVNLTISQSNSGRLINKIRSIHQPTNVTGYDVGWSPEDVYQHKTYGQIEIARVAKILHMGGPVGKGNEVPPRPFMTRANNKFHPVLRRMLSTSARANASGRAKLENLKAIGEAHAAQVGRSINEFKRPANSPKTAKRKGFNDPLTETTEMEETVDYAITRKQQLRS